VIQAAYHRSVPYTLARSEKSTQTLRAELLDQLALLFPERTWPSRVLAGVVADFAVANLSQSAVRRLSAADRVTALRALHLAETIIRRARRQR
jgi:hypothetical protein